LQSKNCNQKLQSKKLQSKKFQSKFQSKIAIKIAIKKYNNFSKIAIKNCSNHYPTISAHVHPANLTFSDKNVSKSYRAGL